MAKLKILFDFARHYTPWGKTVTVRQFLSLQFKERKDQFLTQRWATLFGLSRDLPIVSRSKPERDRCHCIELEEQGGASSRVGDPQGLLECQFPAHWRSLELLLFLLLEVERKWGGQGAEARQLLDWSWHGHERTSSYTNCTQQMRKLKWGLKWVWWMGWGEGKLREGAWSAW